MLRATRSDGLSQLLRIKEERTSEGPPKRNPAVGQEWPERWPFHRSSALHNSLGRGILVCFKIISLQEPLARSAGNTHGQSHVANQGRGLYSHISGSTRFGEAASPGQMLGGHALATRSCRSRTLATEWRLNLPPAATLQSISDMLLVVPFCLFPR